MKKYFIAILITCLHANAMENNIKVPDDIKKIFILNVAHDSTLKESIKNIRSLALVNKKFNKLINEEKMTQELIDIVSYFKTKVAFEKNQKKPKKNDPLALFEKPLDSISETLAPPYEFDSDNFMPMKKFIEYKPMLDFMKNNKLVYDIKAALKLSTRGTKNWFETKYLTKEKKQQLLKYMAGEKSGTLESTDKLIDKIAPLCNGIKNFNTEASSINDNLQSSIKKVCEKKLNYDNLPTSHSAVILGTQHALHNVIISEITPMFISKPNTYFDFGKMFISKPNTYFDFGNMKNNIKDFEDYMEYFSRDTLLIKQIARYLKKIGKTELIENRIHIEEITNDDPKILKILLKIIKDIIPANNDYLARALFNSNPELAQAVMEVLDERLYNLKILNLDTLISKNYQKLFELFIKDSNFNCQKLTTSPFRVAMEYDRQDMFSSLLNIIVSIKKLMVFKTIIFDAIETKNSFFFDKLLEYEEFYTNFKVSPLQFAIKQGKLERAFKLLEKIKTPDPEALKLAQKFSYNEIVEQYNKKIFDKKKKSDCSIF